MVWCYARWFGGFLIVRFRWLVVLWFWFHGEFGFGCEVFGFRGAGWLGVPCLLYGISLRFGLWVVVV